MKLESLDVMGMGMGTITFFETMNLPLEVQVSMALHGFNVIV